MFRNMHLDAKRFPLVGMAVAVVVAAAAAMVVAETTSPQAAAALPCIWLLAHRVHFLDTLRTQRCQRVGRTLTMLKQCTLALARLGANIDAK